MAKKKKKSMYDGVVSFSYPLHITNDKGDIISIYGLLYNRREKHSDDLWTWQINRFIAYLMGCEKVQTNNGGLSPEMWILPTGRMINLNVHHKNLIYSIMREKGLMQYRLLEFLIPLEVGEDDADDVFITSQEFMMKVYQDPYN